MKILKLLFTFCFIALFFTCTSPQNPFTQDKAKVFLHLESSTKATSDSTITDTAGNKIRIGISYFMPDYFDSVVITINKSIQEIDTFFVCKKTDIKDDTTWFECAFKNEGIRTVTATGYVEGGYKPTTTATITVIARLILPINHKPTLVISGQQDITTAETCTLLVSANHADTNQTLAYKVLKGPQGYTFSNQIFIWKPSPADSGVDSVTFTVADNGSPVMADTQTIGLTVKGIAVTNNDTTKPIIKFFDPPSDSLAISASSRMVKVIATDSSGISGLRIALNSDTFPTTRADSVWTATISNLKIGYNTITITATDLSPNKNVATRQFTIKYDPTLGDNTGPTITQVSGPVSSSRVLTDSLSFSFQIKDTSGIDSVFCKINDTASGIFSRTGYNFNLKCKLSNYGQNTIQIIARDSSTRKNESSIALVLTYNTMPSAISMIYPQSGDTAIDNTNGVLLQWTKSQDKDGDSIKYAVFYSESTSVFKTIITKDDTMRLSDLKNGKKYFFFVLTLTVLDSLRCPAAIGTYNNFTTKIHHATISGFIDKKASINDSVSYNVIANAPDGTREYRWDLYGDGKNIKVTSIGSVTFTAPSTPGVYKSILSFVDTKDAITLDTAILTVTDNIPVVTVADTVTAGIGIAARIKVTATDDGTGLIYKISNTFSGTYQPFSGDTSVTLADTSLPYITKRFIQVVDDDGHIVPDSVLIIKRPITTIKTMPYSGILKSFTGMYLIEKGASIIRSTNGTTWDSVTPNMPLSAFFPKGICYSKGKYYLSGKDSLYQSLNDTGWVGIIRFPYMMSSGGQGMGRSDFAVRRLRNEFIVAGGWSMAGAGTYQDDSAFVTGIDYGISEFYQPLSIVHPVGAKTFPICEDKDTVFCLEGAYTNAQQYLTAITYDAVSNPGKPVIKYRNPLQSKLLTDCYTSIFAENGVVYIADRTGIWRTNDKSLHWTPLIISGLPTNGIIWLGRYQGKFAYQAAGGNEIILIDGF